MPEFRQDPVSGRWVIMAAARARRPETFAGRKRVASCDDSLPSRRQECPFCSGNEALTPPEVLALTGPDQAGGITGGSGWRVRVVRNKFPALDPEVEDQVEKLDCFYAGDEFYRSAPGYGIHEVIVETPEHNQHPATLTLEQAALVVEAYYRRYAALEETARLRYIQLFRNHGRAAGASIEHPHSQLVALPFVPQRQLEELQRAQRYYLKHGRCLYCQLLEREWRARERIVAENESFIAFMPFSSRYPFESWLMPRSHQASLVELSRNQRTALAALLRELLGCYYRALEDPPYNFYLHSAPLRCGGLPYFHWRLELAPRLATPGGFEMGTEIMINTTLPEEAAAFIRDRGSLIHESWKKDLFYPGFAQPSIPESSMPLFPDSARPAPAATR